MPYGSTREKSGTSAAAAGTSAAGTSADGAAAGTSAAAPAKKAAPKKAPPPAKRKFEDGPVDPQAEAIAAALEEAASAPLMLAKTLRIAAAAAAEGEISTGDVMRQVTIAQTKCFEGVTAVAKYLMSKP